MNKKLKKEILDLSKKLIRIESTKENPQNLKKALYVAKSRLEGISYKSFKKKSVESLLFYNTQKLPDKFNIILNAHLDVVSGKARQFKPQVTGNRLYGRGVLDMKSAAAVNIILFSNLSDKLKYPLGLQLVTDEETGGFCGTKYQLESGVRSDFVVAGENTNLNIGNKAKGILWAQIISKGETAHASLPWEGKNSIWKMVDFINRLNKKFPEPTSNEWKTTINLSSIKTSNLVYNKVPNECVLNIDVRFLPKDSETIKNKIKTLLPTNTKLKIVLFEPSAYTSVENNYVKLLHNSATDIIGKNIEFISKNGGSDIRHFNKVGTKGVVFGPSGKGIHSDNEWLDIQSLYTYHKILESFLISCSSI